MAVWENLPNISAAEFLKTKNIKSHSFGFEQNIDFLPVIYFDFLFIFDILFGLLSNLTYLKIHVGQGAKHDGKCTHPV